MPGEFAPLFFAAVFRLAFPLASLAALTLTSGCAGNAKPGAQPGVAPADTVVPKIRVLPDSEFLSSALVSEAAEFIRLGRESLDDSEWYDASEYFDSAMVHLTEVESTDSLSPEMGATTRAYQDSVRGWLVQAVSEETRLGEAEDLSDFMDRQIEGVPDSALTELQPALKSLPGQVYDLPLPQPLPPRVLQALQVFTGPGRGYFTRWLQRKSRYDSLISARLAERKMPKDLLYLSMVESGFNPKAWSRASASGIWQFISSTGRRYGLQDDWWVDPRRDPAQATSAALDYLEDLYTEFGDWHLAMAAYNCGENRIRKSREKDSTLGYWNMDLPEETRFYVPKILAAMIIGHNPKAFGFDLEKREPPLRFDTATVNHCLPLHGIAKAMGISVDSLKELNPALRRWCTPPGRNGYTLCLPEGSRDAFYANYKNIDTATLTSWRRHVVTRKDNLGSLATHYGVSIAAIQAANQMRGTRIHVGQSLIIPVPEGAGSEEEPEDAPKRSKLAVVGKYKVKSGETLYDIARRFHVSVRALRDVNKMSNNSVLQAGKILRVPQGISAPESREVASAPAVAPVGPHRLYVVRKGETLYSIGLALGVKQEDLRHWNGLAGTTLYAGQKLVYQASDANPGPAAARGDSEKIDVASSDGNGPRQFYRVKAGDSLWDISVRFGQSLDALKKMNNHLSDFLRPGQKIRVR